MTTPRLHSSGVSIDVPIASEYEQILTSEALAFLHELHQRFDARRRELLAKRVERQKAIDAGQLPNFLPETESIRKADWKVAPIPAKARAVSLPIPELLPVTTQTLPVIVIKLQPLNAVMSDLGN